MDAETRKSGTNRAKSRILNARIPLREFDRGKAVFDMPPPCVEFAHEERKSPTLPMQYGRAAHKEPCMRKATGRSAEGFFWLVRGLIRLVKTKPDSWSRVARSFGDGNPAILALRAEDPWLCAPISRWVCLYRSDYSNTLSSLAYVTAKVNRVFSIHRAVAKSIDIVCHFDERSPAPRPGRGCEIASQARREISPLRRLRFLTLQKPQGSKPWHRPPGQV